MQNADPLGPAFLFTPTPTRLVWGFTPSKVEGFVVTRF